MPGVVLAAYVVGALAVYGPFGWARLSEVLRIPLIDYAAVFLLAGIDGTIGHDPPARRNGP